MDVTRRASLGCLGGVAGAWTLGALGGCGGGGADGGAVRKLSLEVSSLTPSVGDRVRLTARFEGGRGRIEPGLGAVLSGQTLDTPVLDRPGTMRFALVVEADGQPAQQREVQLQVAYRDRYQALPSIPLMAYHTATLLGDGQVLLTGGSRGGNSLSDAVDRFDPATRQCAHIGSLRTGRGQHTATLLADGRVLVLGGNSGVQIGPVADLVDPLTGAVSDGGRLVLPRSWHAVVALPDGRALVVGGLQRDSVELWDPATRRFRLVAQRMRHPRSHPSATLLADGRVLIVGGDHLASVNAEAEVFDPRTEQFTAVEGGANTRRTLHQAHRLGDGSVMVLGGERYEAGGTELLASALRYDPRANTLAAIPALDRARSLFQSVLLPNDEILLFGGDVGADTMSTSASSYQRGRDPAARALAAMPEARAWHTATRLHDGRILLVGGEAAPAVRGACWYE